MLIGGGAAGGGAKAWGGPVGSQAAMVARDCYFWTSMIFFIFCNKLSTLDRVLGSQCRWSAAAALPRCSSVFARC